jgi:hypothetical protein
MGHHRYRQYTRAFLSPSRLLEWMADAKTKDGNPICEFSQGVFNPEFKNEARRLPALAPSAKTNPLLLRLIETDFAQTFWDDRDELLPLAVGVHFIKLMVENPVDEAVSSPPCLHQDGESFTFVHLIERENVEGGVNSIATTAAVDLVPDELARGMLLDQFQLEAPLDSFGVCDSMVSHHVSSVRRGSAPRPGKRSVILVDFTPMIPRPFVTT